ncbi:MAG: hypothetical protein U0P30_00085 [Vicinamibacterales bacterium]
MLLLLLAGADLHRAALRHVHAAGRQAAGSRPWSLEKVLARGGVHIDRDRHV